MSYPERKNIFLVDHHRVFSVQFKICNEERKKEKNIHNTTMGAKKTAFVCGFLLYYCEIVRSRSYLDWVR